METARSCENSYHMILLAMGSAPPAFEGKHVTIAQLEQILNTLEGKSDSRIAHELSSLELTERASSVRLSRWEREFHGSRAREAFTLLADALAFLDLPALAGFVIHTDFGDVRHLLFAFE
jgi:hypothetical protein